MKRRGFLAALLAPLVAPVVPRRWWSGWMRPTLPYKWRTYGVITFHGAPIIEDLYTPAKQSYLPGDTMFVRWGGAEGPPGPKPRPGGRTERSDVQGGLA